MADESEEKRRARHHERLKLEARASYPDEDSAVIEQEALSRAPKSSSTPPHAKGLIAILNTLPPWGRVLVVLALLALVGASGIATKLSGLW